MTIDTISSSASTATAAGPARASGRSGAAKSLFPQIFGLAEADRGRVAPRPDLHGEDGRDRAETIAQSGPADGKNGPAGFAALDGARDGRLNADELSSADIFFAGDLSAWLASEADVDADGTPDLDESCGSEDADRQITLADLQAEVAWESGRYCAGGRDFGEPMTPLDPSAPDYLRQVRERLSAIGEIQPTPPGQEALSRLLRENFARLTEQMVAEVARPRALS